MRVIGTSVMAAMLPFLLGGCGWLGHGGKKSGESVPLGPGGIPPQLRSKTDAAATGATAGDLAPGGRSTGRPAVFGQITPEEDIVWTDPDNPDAEIPELDKLLKSPTRRGPWEQSEPIAKRRAMREGKCLLIWFTDSLRSPSCKTLDRELFSTKEFEDWAEKNVIRLRVDANVDAAVRGKRFDDSMDVMDFRVRAADYVKKLKKRYRVLGHPTLVVLSPQGEVIARYRGFRKGNADFVWGQIKSGVIAGEKSYHSWRKRLEKRGYRTWTDRKGRKVFAKLIAYRNGDLLLIEPDGQRARTSEKRLGDADRLWIEQQKRESQSRKE